MRTSRKTTFAPDTTTATASTGKSGAKAPDSRFVMDDRFAAAAERAEIAGEEDDYGASLAALE